MLGAAGDSAGKDIGTALARGSVVEDKVHGADEVAS